MTTTKPPIAIRSTVALTALLGLMACASDREPLRAQQSPIQVERFMGDWYVLSSIPIDIPFFSEANAYDAVERYRLEPDGKIDIEYTFRDGSFEAEPRVLTQRGEVIDGRGTEWRIQFVWPFKSAYLIAWVDERYTRAIVGVPSRRYVWVLSREATIPDAELAALEERVVAMGYDKPLRRVPQQPAATEQESP